MNPILDILQVQQLLCGEEMEPLFEEVIKNLIIKTLGHSDQESSAASSIHDFQIEAIERNIDSILESSKHLNSFSNLKVFMFEQILDNFYLNPLQKSSVHRSKVEILIMEEVPRMFNSEAERVGLAVEKVDSRTMTGKYFLKILKKSEKISTK